MSLNRQYTFVRDKNGTVTISSDMVPVTLRWYEGRTVPQLAYGDESLGSHHLSVSIIFDVFGEDSDWIAGAFTKKVLALVKSDSWSITSSQVEEFTNYFVQARFSPFFWDKAGYSIAARSPSWLLSK